MVEKRSLSELWLDGKAGSVSHFLSQFSNLHMVVDGLHPRLLPLAVCPWKKTRKVLHQFIASLVRNG